MPAHASLVIRACVSFDLVVTGLLAVPFTARVFVSALYASSGASPAPELPGIAWFFVNFAGALGVLCASRAPSPDSRAPTRSAAAPSPR